MSKKNPYDPLELLDLYLAKGLSVAYCDTNKSRLDLAVKRNVIDAVEGGLLSEIETFDMSEEIDDECNYDLGIFVLTDRWKHKYLVDLPKMTQNVIFIATKDFLDNERDPNDDSHGWTET